MNNNLLKIKPYQPGKPIDEVKRELGLKSVIKLASNENPYGPSPKVRAAIAQAVKEINRYPDGGCSAAPPHWRLSVAALAFSCRDVTYSEEQA